MKRIALHRPTAPTLWVALLALTSATASPARATLLTVPDDAPSIQVALDQRVDTVLVRPAAYAEVPVISHQVYLSSSSEDVNAPLPSLKGLYILPASVAFIPRFAVSRLRFEDPVYMRNDDIICYMAFAHCQFRGGIVDLTEYIITNEIRLHRCEVQGGVHLGVDGICSLDSCVVNGDVAVGNMDARLFVSDCVFNGPGFGTAIAATSVYSSVIERNHIQGFYLGTYVYGEDSVRVQTNEVTNCGGIGIRADGNHIVIADNDVRHCGTGVMAQTYTSLMVVQNRVGWAGDVGIYVVNADSVCNNVVWESGLDGIHVGGGPRSVCHNTSCMNKGSGIEAEFGYSSSDEYLRVTGNVGYGNGDVGMEWLTPNATVVACNDWFGNAMGDVRGRPGSPEDFSEDAQFCDASGGDFRLRDTSPLVDRPGCGQVGALGVGCGVTSTLVQRFNAGRVSGGIRVVWEIADGATVSEVWLERSEGSREGPWTRPSTERSLDNRQVIELDRSAIADRAYWYQLVALEAGNSTVIGSPILVGAQVPLECRLTEVGANPGSGPLRIVFALRQAAAVEIDVFDVQGRRVASPGRGTWPAGTHEVIWDGRARNGQPVPAGMYVVRYTYPGGQDRRAVVRLL